MPENADPMSALRDLEAKATPGGWSFEMTGSEGGTLYVKGERGRIARFAARTFAEDQANGRFTVAAVEYTRAALRASLAPDTRDTAEVERIAAVIETTIDSWADNGDNGLVNVPDLDVAARALYDAGLRAPSLEGARHPEQEDSMNTYAVNYIGDCFGSKWPCNLAGEPHEHAYVAVLVPDEGAAIAQTLGRHPGVTIEGIVNVVGR